MSSPDDRRPWEMVEKLAYAVLESNEAKRQETAARREETEALRLLRKDVRDAMTQGEKREEGHTAALLKLYERLGGHGERLSEIAKDVDDITGPHATVEEEKKSSGNYLAVGGWRIPLVSLWKVVKIALPLIGTGGGIWTLVHHLLER